MADATEADMAATMTLRPPITIWSLTRGPALVARARAAGWDAALHDESVGAGQAILAVDLAAKDDAAAAVIGKSGAAAVLLLAGDGDRERLAGLLDAGATHLGLVAPDGDGLIEALRFASIGMARSRRERRGSRVPGAGALIEWIDARSGEAEPLTVIHVELLRLDLVNAAYGRHTATALIAAAERRVTAQVEALADKAGQVARGPGGGITAAILGTPDLAVLAAARIEEALEQPFRLDAVEAVLGVSIGIAGSRPGEGAVALIARAADQAGRPLPASVLDDDGLAADLHLALARGEVTVRFQPQAAIDGDAIIGVEALARWDHPVLGALGAESLLAAAQRAGLGIALSDHIQRRVLAQASAWPASMAALRLSLNLTAADLARPRFAEHFLAHVDASGFPRTRLTLEITETGLMADLTASALLLGGLRAAGCRIAIDDFGTGYSSLAYLKALPIDYLKLDKALAQDIAGTTRDQVVVRGAIDMARSLGIEVIAEGVETREQRDLLAAAGCSIYQGYLLAEPLTEAELIALLGA